MFAVSAMRYQTINSRTSWVILRLKRNFTGQQMLIEIYKGRLDQKDLTRVTKGGTLDLTKVSKGGTLSLDRNIGRTRKRARLTRISIGPGSSSQKPLSQKRRSERKGNKRQE